MINISSETPEKKRIDTDIVKATVGGDWVTGRNPHEKPVKFKPYAKHYLAMNKIPIIDDDSHGMWRRLYIIEFPRKFEQEEMDVYLTEKLKGELSGIFNWSLEGYHRLTTQNFIFTKGTSLQMAKKHYKDQSNSVLTFASQHLQPGEPDERVKFKDVYEFYKVFCQTEGEKSPYKKKDFRTTLETAGYDIKKSTKDNNQINIFGVNLVTILE